MPMRPARICACGKKVPSGVLCECVKRRRAAAEAKRPTAHQRGYTSKWARESAAFLALPGNEFCACGCGRKADMVDHITAHKGDKRLFWSRSNWQPYASFCNRRKNVREEGGFGNPRTS